MGGESRGCKEAPREGSGCRAGGTASRPGAEGPIRGGEASEGRGETEGECSRRSRSRSDQRPLLLRPILVSERLRHPSLRSASGSRTPEGSYHCARGRWGQAGAKDDRRSDVLAEPKSSEDWGEVKHILYGKDAEELKEAAEMLSRAPAAAPGSKELMWPVSLNDCLRRTEFHRGRMGRWQMACDR
eukprot:755282-Hanusia_phi.AAC.4